jgi:hypothetical protein
MLYSIYNFISSEKELEIKSRIKTIAPILNDFMAQHEFYLNTGPQSEDSIGLDYSYEKRSTGLMGNIGFKYIDEVHAENDEEFIFYVLKAIDVSRQRLYKRSRVPNHNIKISDLESSSVIYLETCVNLFNKWGFEDLDQKKELKYT